MRDEEHGKRSLFGAPTGGSRQRVGRDRTDRSGRITIDCARCGASTRVTTRDALGRLLRFSLWVPGRTYSRRLVCPSCDRRSWVRLRLL